MTTNVGILFDRIRVEEKLILEEMNRRGVDATLLDVRRTVFDLDEPSSPPFDVLLNRSVSFSHSVAALRVLETAGVVCVNASGVADVCGDKLRTSLALVRDGVPTPRVRVAFSRDAALDAIESLGYPVVLKPTVGSWGRLLALINDRHAAEAVLEHKETLGGFTHSTYYIQEFIRKPGRDIRSFVVGDETICAIARTSEHWITNTARGGRASNFPVAPDLDEISRAAARAVGGGILAIDILENLDGELLVNEVNHTMEFRNSIEPTGVNIPARIVDYVVGATRTRVDRPDLELVEACGD